MEIFLFWALITSTETDAILMQDLERQQRQVQSENIEALVPPVDMSAPRTVDEEGRILHIYPTPNSQPAGQVELHITKPGFVPDFLHLGLYFVSKTWRDAAALKETEAQYFPVDASKSTPEVQAADYRVLWPTATRDWIDLEKAGTDVYPPGHPNGVLRATRRVFKEGIDVDVDLFHTPHFPDLFVTEALAERMRAAGIGVDFMGADGVLR